MIFNGDLGVKMLPGRRNVGVYFTVLSVLDGVEEAD